jgi:pimeloyl-ACP methyl ester carboxylesterase
MSEKRELSYVEWRNHWAWMESMKGKQWDQLLQHEQSHYNRLASQKRVKSLAKEMEKEIREAQQYLYLPGFQAGSGLLDITMTPDKQFYWKRSWHKRYKKAYDLDVDQDHVWYITDGDKPNTYELFCEDHHGKITWRKKDISSNIAVIGQLCYYIGTNHKGNNSILYGCEASTGLHPRKLYEEKDEEKSIGLIRASYRTLYMISDDPTQSRTYRVNGLRLQHVFQGSLFQMPLGCHPEHGEMGLIRNSIHTPWKPHGRFISHWSLPTEEILWMNVTTGHVITVNEGSECLWFCSPSTEPKVLLRLKAGSFFYNEWEAWEQSTHQRLMVQCPMDVPFLLHAFQDRLARDPPSRPIAKPISFKPLEVHKFHTISADGTRVPYVVIYEKGVKPIGQLVYVYGAYGSNTPVLWPHTFWRPLLRRKWAIVYAFVRGGGDHTEEWANSARREFRHRTVDDYEAVIRASQQRLRLTPHQTVLYGRSAGGLPVGAIVARWPNGELAKAAFTEVPYVDILRTSTNPDLPLTVGEYEEFGNPQNRIVNFRELLHVSPINSLPAEGAPGVFVLSRVGLKDNQVYAYESFKWIQRLRGYVSPDPQQDHTHPKQKYVTYQRDEKHVYRVKTFPHFRGLDLAILDSWLHHQLSL